MALTQQGKMQGMQWSPPCKIPANIQATFKDVSAEPQGPGEFLHGELEIPSKGILIKYLLVPRSKIWDPEAVLRTVLSPDLWGLETPNLTVQPMGPLGFWPDSVNTVYDEGKKAEWGADEEKRKDEYQRVIKDLGTGVISAVVESSGWMFSTYAQYFSHDHAGVIMSESVSSFRSNHPGAEFVYVGCGLVGQMLQDRDGYDPNAPFTLDTPGKLDLAACAVPVGSKIEKRVQYPWLGEYIWPDSCHNEPSDRGAATFVIPHFVTHYILFDNVQLDSAGKFDNQTYRSRPDWMFESLVTSSMPHASVIIGGKDETRVFKYSADLSARGCNIIVLEHTGEWADKLCIAVRRLRDQKEKGGSGHQVRSATDPHPDVPMLPPETDERKYQLFNALVDSSEVIVSRLTKTLTAVTGGESNELGFADNERRRLQEAWTLYTKLKINAETQQRVAFRLHFVIIALSFATTFAVGVYSYLDHEDAEDGALNKELPHLQSYLGVASSVLPLCSSLFQSLFGVLSPVPKFAYMALGAARVKSVIYKYRARVGDFSPSSTSGQLQEALTKDSSGGKKGSSKPQGLGAQANFASALENIETSALTDMKDSSLRMPGKGDFQASQREAKMWFMPQRRSGPADSAKTPLKGSTVLDDLQAMDDNTSSGQQGGYSLIAAVVRDEAYDDLASLLTGEDYLEFRLLPMMQHYRQRSRSLEFTVRVLQVSTLLFTFVAALLSIFSYKVLVPAAVAAAASTSSWLEFTKMQTRLSNCNQARNQLESLHRWWGSLSMVKQRTNVCKTTLVELAEEQADAEESVWAKSLETKKKKEDEEGEDDKDK